MIWLIKSPKRMTEEGNSADRLRPGSPEFSKPDLLEVGKGGLKGRNKTLDLPLGPREPASQLQRALCRQLGDI